MPATSELARPGVKPELDRRFLVLAPADIGGGLFVAMTLAVQELPRPDSSLARLDPRWKLAALVLATLATAALTQLPAAALALAGALLLAAWARLPPRWFLARLGNLLPFLILIGVVFPLAVRDGGPGFHWGPCHLSLHGLRLAGLLAAKAVAIVTLMMVLLATAPLTVTLHAAHRLRLPGLFVHLSLLTYRYLFLLAQELGRLRIALRVRGYRNRANWHSYRTIGHVAGTLLVRSSERAERVGQAMRCRGFEGRFRSLVEFRTTAADVAVFALIAAIALMILAWDFFSLGKT